MAKHRIRIKLDFVCEAETAELFKCDPEVVGACAEAARHLLLKAGSTGTFYIEPGAYLLLDQITLNPPKKKTR